MRHTHKELGVVCALRDCNSCRVSSLRRTRTKPKLCARDATVPARKMLRPEITPATHTSSAPKIFSQMAIRCWQELSHNGQSLGTAMWLMKSVFPAFKRVELSLQCICSILNQVRMRSSPKSAITLCQLMSTSSGFESRRRQISKTTCSAD